MHAGPVSLLLRVHRIEQHVAGVLDGHPQSVPLLVDFLHISAVHLVGHDAAALIHVYDAVGHRDGRLVESVAVQELELGQTLLGAINHSLVTHHCHREELLLHDLEPEVVVISETFN